MENPVFMILSRAVDDPSDRGNGLGRREPRWPKIRLQAIFPVSPGHVFSYQIQASGTPPITYSAESMPATLKMIRPAAGLAARVCKPVSTGSP